MARTKAADLAWPDILQDRVRLLAQDGLSANMIAAQIGKSKSAVCGWCWRNDVTLYGWMRAAAVAARKRG
jgi:hypothetical protein